MGRFRPFPRSVDDWRSLTTPTHVPLWQVAIMQSLGPGLHLPEDVPHKQLPIQVFPKGLLGRASKSPPLGPRCLQACVRGWEGGGPLG